MNFKTREATNRLYFLMDNDMLPKDLVIDACLSYLSEADVARMMEMNDFDVTPDDEDDEDE